VAEQSWLEISLTVDGELAEAVAEVLARFFPNGIVIESTKIDDHYDDSPEGGSFGSPSGPLRVYGYLRRDSQLEDTRKRLEEALWHLGQIEPLPTPQYQVIAQQDWMAAWKQHYRPIPVGQRLVVTPAWLEPEEAGRIPIRIDPGMAFGTGTHPTTQLCLELLEERMRPGGALIDVGCGSGILSITAAKLGAEPILGVDVDEAAIANAEKNAQVNQVRGKIEFGIGSVKEIIAKQFSLQIAPMVLTNILTPVLRRLLDDGLAELLTADGELILSGILEENEAEMLAALRGHQLEAVARRQRKDWIALVVRQA
jgi:ribosomal protein L11 methyltransferase